MTRQATSILLVEDEPVIALDVRRRLQQLGYSPPLTATTGEEAIDLAELHQPDLVLMDIILSGDMDGIDAASRIRNSLFVPIIYLTAHADPDTLQRAKITEPFGYIMKPFEDRELHTCIEMALYKHEMERDLRHKERWFATTLRSIGDAVVSLNDNGEITLINEAAEKLFELSDAEVTGLKFAEAFRVRDDKSGLYISTRAALGKNDLYTHPSPATVERPSGKYTPVDISITETADRFDQIAGSVIVLRDATDRKRSEEVLRTSLVELRRTFEQTVQALSLTSEKRDPYTAGHQSRVAKLACAIAHELGVEGDTLEAVRVAGTLHDIGKIYIPAEILSKPGRLTELEMNLMRTHPSVGFDILSRISFPWPVAEIVHQHHERLDGSGYPNGLSENNILLEARILAVADVVEAMSSHRPYRPSLGLAPALGEIMAGKGRFYDPEVVDACIALFETGFQLTD